MMLDVEQTQKTLLAIRKTHCAAEFDDLCLCVVLKQLVEEVLIDVLVVDKETLRVVQRGLFRGGEVGIAPGRNLADRFLIEGLCFP